MFISWGSNYETSNGNDQSRCAAASNWTMMLWFYVSIRIKGIGFSELSPFFFIPFEVIIVNCTNFTEREQCRPDWNWWQYHLTSTFLTVHLQWFDVEGFLDLLPLFRHGFTENWKFFPRPISWPIGLEIFEHLRKPCSLCISCWYNILSNCLLQS